MEEINGIELLRRKSPFVVIGHRGSPRRAAENSLASLTLALDEGADGVETDLRRLASGELVLFHDDEHQGNPFESFSIDALRGAVSLTLLHEVALLARRGVVVLEVKRTGFERELQALVREWGDDLIVSSFDHRVLDRLRREGFRGHLGVLYSGYLVEAVGYARRFDASVIFPHHHFVEEEMVKEAVAAGMAVVPWTSNREGEWEEFARIGCHGIITDLPLEAVLWRAAALKC